MRNLIPRGYSIVSRKDRTKQGGGILLGAKQHLLCTLLDLKEYNVPCVAEMDGFSLDEVYYIGCYTPNSYFTHILIDMLTKLQIDNPGRKFILMGDFNCHHKEWLCSAVPTDYAGIVTQEFCESFGLHQYVNFPTRGPNTLDLIICNSPGSAEALPNFGTSDLVAIKFKCNVDNALDSEPPNTPVLNWMTASWNHIRGAVKRALSVWNDSDYEAEALMKLKPNSPTTFNQ